MSSFGRTAFALALTLCLPAAFSQSPSSSSNSPDPALKQSTDQSAASQPQSTASVQSRIRQRREQRRIQAIHDVYSHRYEAAIGMGYLRFLPGPGLQRVTYYAWDTGLTRYSSERLGITVDARGYYGTAYVGLNQVSNSAITRPSISTYAIMAGPIYRFYLQPKYSVSGRVMGGYARGNFSSDTNGFGSTALGLYPDGSTYAISAALIGEYNLSPGIGLRLAPEYFATGFGSTLQNSLGFTAGVVFRFGKQ